MRTRAQLTLQVLLALLCAAGAGISGDLYARHSNHSTQAARHARRHHPRNTRNISRQNQEEHVLDADLLRTEMSYAAPDSGDGSPAIAAAFVARIVPVFVQMGVAIAARFPVVRSVEFAVPTTRGPPVLL